MIKGDLAAGGLTAISIERLVPCGCAPSAGEVARGYCCGTPLRFELEKRGDLDVLTVAVGNEMTARLGEGPVDCDLAGFLVSGAGGVTALGGVVTRLAIVVTTSL